MVMAAVVVKVIARAVVVVVVVVGVMVAAGAGVIGNIKTVGRHKRGEARIWSRRIKWK